jgi:hypothetical protein
VEASIDIPPTVIAATTTAAGVAAVEHQQGQRQERIQLGVVGAVMIMKEARQRDYHPYCWWWLWWG